VVPAALEVIVSSRQSSEIGRQQSTV
jgi:hypothetical protein